jgi:hypothetical protein
VDQAARVHALSGGVDARQGAAFGAAGHGDGALDAPPGVPRLHHWPQAPGVYGLGQVLRQTLQAIGRFVDGAPVCREDPRWRLGGQPLGESHRSCARPRVARPVERRAYRAGGR